MLSRNKGDMDADDVITRSWKARHERRKPRGTENEEEEKSEERDGGGGGDTHAQKERMRRGLSSHTSLNMLLFREDVWLHHCATYNVFSWKQSRTEHTNITVCFNIIHLNVWMDSKKWCCELCFWYILELTIYHLRHLYPTHFEHRMRFSVAGAQL